MNAAAAQRPEVRKFVEFYLTEGPALAAEVGFVSLPDRGFTDRARSTSANGRVGTVFGGKPEVGVTIEELLERDVKR